LISEGLMALGLPRAEACEYIHSTCVEITPIASSNVWVASPYFNLVQLLHDLLGVPPIGKPEWQPIAPVAPLESFDGLLASYRHHLAETVAAAVREENAKRRHRMRHGGHPLLSCFVNDCLSRGLDIDEGGARYNWIECSFVGLANLTDALAAIRQHVYQERRFTLVELSAILRANYQGHGDARELLTNRAPKYGNAQAEADELAQQVIGWLTAECARQRVVPDGRFVPGLFCWIMHERLGRETAASADGRLAGVPLADGAGPAQGRERSGPTGAILSTTCWDHSPMIGGLVLNLKFSRAPDDHKQAESFLSLLRVYMARRGLEMQINCVNRETLLDAQAHPERYRDLVVRIAGYSDYFTGLSRGMQDEIIARTEHQSF
jgi:formate C-acetyltransferase